MNQEFERAKRVQLVILAITILFSILAGLAVLISQAYAL